jgi:hypothetical protein
MIDMDMLPLKEEVGLDKPQGKETLVLRFLTFLKIYLATLWAVAVDKTPNVQLEVQTLDTTCA